MTRKLVIAAAICVVTGLGLLAYFALKPEADLTQGEVDVILNECLISNRGVDSVDAEFETLERGRSRLMMKLTIGRAFANDLVERSPLLIEEPTMPSEWLWLTGFKLRDRNGANWWEVGLPQSGDRYSRHVSSDGAEVIYFYVRGLDRERRTLYVVKTATSGRFSQDTRKIMFRYPIALGLGATLEGSEGYRRWRSSGR